MIACTRADDCGLPPGHDGPCRSGESLAIERAERAEVRVRELEGAISKMSAPRALAE